MRIKVFLPILALLGCMLMACQDQQAAQPKIGIVDGERLMRDSAPGQQAMKFIEERQNGMQEKLAALQAKMEKNPSDEAIQQEFQKVYSQTIQILQAEAQNAANTVQDVIKNTLNQFREQKGYDMLIYSEIMAAYSNAADVTGDVLAELNKQKVEFKPLPEPASTQGQAPAAPQEKAAEPVEPAPAKDAAPAK